MAARKKSGMTTIFIKDVERVISLNVPSTDNLLLVENLSPFITNERLCAAFTLFGAVKFGYVIVNDLHDATGYGVISFNSKETSIIACKRCEDLKFVITSLPTGVKVTNLRLTDDAYYIGLPQMLINENSSDYQNEMRSTPRFITESNKKENQYSVLWRNLIKQEEKAFIDLKEKFSNMKKTLREDIQQKMLDDERNSLRSRMRNLEQRSGLTTERLNRPLIPEMDEVHEETTTHFASESVDINPAGEEHLGSNQEVPIVVEMNPADVEHLGSNQEVPIMEDIVGTTAEKNDSSSSNEYY